MVFVFIKIEYAAITNDVRLLSIDYAHRVNTYKSCNFCANTRCSPTTFEPLNDRPSQNELQNLPTQRIPSGSLSVASNEQQQQTYEAITSSSPAAALPSDKAGQYSADEISRRGSRHTLTSKARSRLSRFLLGRRTDLKQPTKTPSLESTAEHLGSPVSPISPVESEPSPAELEPSRPPAELPTETYHRARSI